MAAGGDQVELLLAAVRRLEAQVQASALSREEIADISRTLGRIEGELGHGEGDRHRLQNEIRTLRKALDERAEALGRRIKAIEDHKVGKRAVSAAGAEARARRADQRSWALAIVAALSFLLRAGDGCSLPWSSQALPDDADTALAVDDDADDDALVGPGR